MIYICLTKVAFNYWATPTGNTQFKIQSFIGVRNGIPMGRL